MLDKRLYSITILNFLILFFILLLSKIVNHPPNFTPLLSLIIISTLIVRNKIILVLNIFLSMIASDFIIGFYGGISISYLVLIFIVFTADKIFRNINLIKIVYLGLYASILFYLATTPLHFIFDSSNVLSFESLIHYYRDGFYFFLNTLSSTIIFNVLFYYILKNHYPKILNNLEKKPSNV